MCAPGCGSTRSATSSSRATGSAETACRLASLTVRAPAVDALDLCCGSGIQALLAARHARRVVATDLNPRSLRLGVLSAALGGIENVEWRSGDLFEPVGDEQFDLVVSNPPFVISPGPELTFRDGGRRGDELSRQVVEGVASRLRVGGFGHVLCNWAQAPAEDWTAAPRRWLEGSGCDGVVLRLDSQASASYAVRWTSVDARSVDETLARAATWLAYYESLGIESITTGVIVLRRRSGRNWVHADELVWSGRDAGEHVSRIFSGHDALDRLPDERALPGRRLRLPADVRLVERRRPGGALERARLSTDAGIRLPARIEPPRLAAALVALDVRRTLAEAAAAVGLAPADLGSGLSSVRELIRRGYVVVDD